MKSVWTLAAAATAFWTIAMSHAAATPSATVGKPSQRGSAAGLLPADHPTGAAATITPLSGDRATNVHARRLSTFLVDYPPGASAMLHRMPSSGYVLVYVLSGTIRASAWHAGVGTYRAGEMWVQPAFGYSIAAENPNPNEPARILVVLVTGSQEQDDANGTPLPTE
jgi:hypothetical protein